MESKLENDSKDVFIKRGVVNFVSDRQRPNRVGVAVGSDVFDRGRQRVVGFGDLSSCIVIPNLKPKIRYIIVVENSHVVGISDS